MDDFRLISVTRRAGKTVEFDNPTHYEFIGKGSQGAVFKLSPSRCVKIYALPEHRKIESKTYMAMQNSPIIPKLYEVGPNYIIIEYVEGSTLEEYLEIKHTITEELVRQILFMLKEMKRLGFTRLNVRLRHVVVSKQGVLKIIDHVNSFRATERRPIRLFDKLKELGLLKPFLKQVKKIDKKTYREWKKSMAKYL
ncbi:hypothetical protein [Petroclostridium sp. X23]|uniref:hypothetical protein n=1 Tax=Petroclostridium sp. X23 TaxID=3045146 RepID=UPI0024AD9772|nr:hypothetical protein [Petroclostridium sp. X23]WHH58363.1 hypothetical protein QKW49_21575 [Petroclostridium sp. X23]